MTVDTEAGMTAHSECGGPATKGPSFPFLWGDCGHRGWYDSPQ